MPASGQRISEYVLDRRLGAGAFGEVWAARHHVWPDRQIAVKIPIDPQYVRQLRREGATVHRLEHPNIVRALGTDPFAEPPYLLMEYVPGRSLRALIDDGPMNPADAAVLLRQVLAALEYAHGQGVVHGDIKPENILIHERAAAEGFGTAGMMKVTDFGLGLRVASAGSILLSASLDPGEAQHWAGTLDYMSPEQRGGETIDGRADLYACGVVWFELLTGRRPAGTETPRELRGDLPPWTDEVFRRAYARLEKRFASAGEFAQALRPSPPDVPAVREAGRCPQCREAVGAGDQFCIHCGLQLVESVRRCRCGAFPSHDDRFCIRCGAGL